MKKPPPPAPGERCDPIKASMARLFAAMEPSPPPAPSETCPIMGCTFFGPHFHGIAGIVNSSPPPAPAAMSEEAIERLSHARTLTGEEQDALLAECRRARQAEEALREALAPIRGLRITAEEIRAALDSLGPVGYKDEAYVKVAALAAADVLAALKRRSEEEGA